MDGSFEAELKNVLVADILTTEDDRPPCMEDIENYPNLEGIVTFNELNEDKIEMILSAELAWNQVNEYSTAPRGQ